MEAHGVMEVQTPHNESVDVQLPAGGTGEDSAGDGVVRLPLINRLAGN